MTKDEIRDLILQGEAKDEDTLDPSYSVWYCVEFRHRKNVYGPKRLADHGLSILQARILKRELAKRACKAWIEVE